MNVSKILIVLAVAFLTLQSCKESTEAKLDAEVDNMEQEMNEGIQEIRDEMKEAGDEINEELVEIEAKMKDANDEMKAELTERKMELEKWQSEMSSKMNSLEANAKKDWAKFKNDTENWLDDIEADLES